MRCKHCNVDLPDSYTVCPLCHEKAVDEPAFLDIPEAEYPPVYQEYKIPKKVDLPIKYANRVGIVLAIVLGIVSLFTIPELWSIGAPVITSVLCLACFINSFFEKSVLLHSLIALLSVAAFQVIFLIVSLIAKTSLTFMLIGTGICVGLFILTIITKPKRSIDQLKATFML